MSASFPGGIKFHTGGPRKVFTTRRRPEIDAALFDYSIVEQTKTKSLRSETYAFTEKPVSKHIITITVRRTAIGFIHNGYIGID